MTNRIDLPTGTTAQDSENKRSIGSQNMHEHHLTPAPPTAKSTIMDHHFAHSPGNASHTDRRVVVRLAPALSAAGLAFASSTAVANTSIAEGRPTQTTVTVGANPVPANGIPDPAGLTGIDDGAAIAVGGGILALVLIGATILRRLFRKKHTTDARTSLMDKELQSAELASTTPVQSDTGTGTDTNAAAGAGKPAASATAATTATHASAAPHQPPQGKPEPSVTLFQGLAKTRDEGFVGKLGRLFSRNTQIDTGILDQVEEVLFKADIGVQTTNRLVQELRHQLSGSDLASPDKIWRFMEKRSREILDLPVPVITPSHEGDPKVIMVVGVNGVGKTTTIGKLASLYASQGKRVLLAAGDTFRAAAVQQLEIWGERTGSPVVKGHEGTDPSSVMFEAIQRAREEHYDLVIADTAGRLHTKAPLMEELKKIHRVMGKAQADAPHEILLVLDSNTGQNAIHQARQFGEILKLTGLILTKLDGTAKGGIILGICDELKIPVRYIGIGEQAADLRPFDPMAFVDALYGKQTSHP